MNLKCENSYKCKNCHKYEKNLTRCKKGTSNVKRFNKCEKLHRDKWEIIGITRYCVAPVVWHNISNLSVTPIISHFLITVSLHITHSFLLSGYFVYITSNYLVFTLITIFTFEPGHAKTILCHMRTIKTQISLRIHPIWSDNAFVVRCLGSITPLVVIRIFKTLASLHVYVSEQPGLSHTWSQTPEDRFSRDAAHLSFLQLNVFTLVTVLHI